MKKNRIKKLVKQDWEARTFNKKYKRIWGFDLWKKEYYKNNEEGD